MFALTIAVLFYLFQASVSDSVEVFHDVQPSVVDEKFPLLRFALNTHFNDLLSGISITNLANLGSADYTSNFLQGPTVFFVYGWLDTPFNFLDEYTAEITTENENRPFEYLYAAYHFGFDESPNFIGLNWTGYNQNEYLSVISRLQPIANEIGDQLYKMATNANDPVDLTNWHFIGFSLGAHLVGLIARRIKDRSNGQIVISRVTGLDPAGPFLNYPLTSYLFPHLEKSDAKLVDVIHTNAGGFGSSWKIGHIDFWPNFGNKQPGCPHNNDLDILFRPKNICSHTRAFAYYAYSVASQKQNLNNYPSVRCSKNIFNRLQCSSDVTNMGYGIDTAAPEGDYYLITMSEWYWDLREAGAEPFLNKNDVIQDTFYFQ